MKKFTLVSFSALSGLFALGFLLFGLTVMAGEIRLNNNKAEVSFIPGGYQSFSFRTNLPAIQFRDVQTSKGIFTELFAEGYGFSNTVGDPKLPVFHKLIQIPLGSSIEVSITGSQYKDYDLASFGIEHPVIPAQAPLSKNITDPSQIPFIYNEATYQLNQWLGGSLVAITTSGTMRSVQLGRLDLASVQYNPVTHSIRVYETLEVTIHFVNADIPGTISLQQKTWSPYFIKLYGKLPNYVPQNPDTLITGGPVTYVIVSPRMFHDSLQKLVQWKIKKGYHVIQAYTDDPTVGTTTTSIKNYLQNLYNNPPAGCEPPSFILFVGDVAQIPAWTNGGHPSDMKYCDYTGDNIPEVFCGRFSASTAVQLQPYIDKTCEYEQYEIPDDSYLGEATMVAGADATNGPLYGNGQINYGTNNYYNTAHNILSHTYLQPEPTGGNYSVQIRQNVSDGVSFANYTAHGSESGWADPEFIISQIPPLQNDHKYSLLVGNCCKTSNFSTNCFAEEIVRAAHKGALGYIGCSDYSYWDEDYWWACGFKTVTTNPPYLPAHLGAYDVTFHDHGESMDDWYVTLGQMIYGGNLAVEESSSGMKQYYWETYCLMGDPSITLYQYVPSQLTATYPNTLVVGATSLTVNTEPYAYVALSADTLLLDAKTADATGIAELNFDPITEPGSASVVATKQDRKPFMGPLTVIAGNQPFLVLSTFTVDDSIGGNNDQDADYAENIKLNVSISNLGTVPSGDVSGTLVTADTNITIVSGTYNFGTISGGATIIVEDAFEVTIKNNVADQHVVAFELQMTDGTNNWISPLNLVLNAPDLAVMNYYILDPAPGGNNNGILDPGESASLKIRVLNQGHASVNNAISHLSVMPGSEPYIALTNPDYYIGTLDVNSLMFTYTDIECNGITPIGTVVNINDLLTAGAANQYSAQKELPIEIGEVPDYNMNNGTVTTCTGHFYDSGGPNGNYSDNENLNMTIQPGTSGSVVQVVFTQFDVEPQANCAYDYLRIYDGPGTTSPLIGTFCGTDSPGTVTSTTGPLTFVFHSDYSDPYPGWAASISCAGGPLNLIANAFPSDVCEGSSSQLVAIPSGGSGNYTYEWSPVTYLDDPYSRTPVSTPAENITYTVTVNDGVNQVVSDPVVLTVVPKPTAPVITDNGTQLISDVTTGNQWYLNGGMIPGATEQTYTPVESGIYYATVTDAVSGCQSDPSNTIQFAMVGINPLTGNDPVLVYPNPFSDRMNVAYSVTGKGQVRLSLTDAFGKELRILASYPSLADGKYTLNFSRENLNAGCYFLKVQTGTYTVVKKIMLIN